MEINNLKDLQKIIALCHKQGVTSIKLGELELHLGPMPVSRKRPDFSSDFPEANIKVPQYQEVSKESATQETADKIATDELTPEQLLFYSSQGHIEQ